jgi:CubicO group peptidase (beta-lactamase class C family)
MRCLALWVLIVAFLMAPAWAGADEELKAILDRAVEEHGFPAIGGMVVSSEGVLAMEVSGVRKLGADASVERDDQWHLGSNTKAMTATLIGKLVDEGKLRWDSTLEELFPEVTDMHAGFRPVTVAQVLTHRGGFLANLPWGIMPKSGDMAKVRYDAVALALTMEPAHEPGGGMVYSNTGYVVLGVIIEQARGEAWEDVIEKELFVPLGMTSAGFGGVGTLGEIDQPWPHMSKETPAPHNGPAMDNPPVMGPAGTVHCSLEDYGKFLAEHLRGARGQDGLLKAETYGWLHSARFGGDYGGGLLVAEREWAGGRVMTHAGSNTMNFAVAWMAPEIDRAFVVVTNVGGKEVPREVDGVVAQMIEAHGQGG